MPDYNNKKKNPKPLDLLCFDDIVPLQPPAVKQITISSFKPLFAYVVVPRSLLTYSVYDITGGSVFIIMNYQKVNRQCILCSPCTIYVNILAKVTYKCMYYYASLSVVWTMSLLSSIFMPTPPSPVLVGVPSSNKPAPWLVLSVYG